MGSLYYNPNTGKQVSSGSVVREEKAAAKTKKARQKPIVARRRAIARGTAPAVARAQNPLTPAPQTRRASPVRPQGDARQAFLRDAYEAAGIRPGGPAQPVRRVSTAGPDLTRLALLNNNTDTTWLGGLVQNAARGGLNLVTGIPGSAQLLGEAALTPFANIYAGTGLPGTGGSNTPAEKLRDKLNSDVQNAARSQIDFVKYNFGPLAQGDLRTFGSRVYDDPVGVLSTLAAGYSAAGRAGNIGARIARRVAPESQVAARASRLLSELPHKDRAAIVTQENMRRRAAGEKPLPFEPGHGKRYRPPVTERSTVGVNEPGVPVAGANVRQVPRKGYSYNAITRSAQRRMDRLSEKRRPAREARANKAQQIGDDAGFAMTLKSLGLRRATSESRAGRALKRETLDMADRYDSRAEVDVNRKANGLARSLRRLKKEQTAAGIPGKERISSEEMAVTLHWQDVASARGGLSPAELRDRAVRSLEGGIERRISREARQVAKKNGISYRQAREAIAQSPWVAESRAQVETIRRVPDKLLRLDDLSDPQVKRVADAVSEGRRVDELNQAQSVAAEVVTPETAEAIRSRTSGLLLGGQKWWQDAVADVHRAMNPKIQGLRKAAARARAEGDHPKARKLEARLTKRIEARRRKIADIKAGATRPSKQLDEARAAYAESNTRLSEAKQVGTPDEISARTRSRDMFKKRLDKMEREALGFTKARRPELVGDSGVYIPDRLPPKLRQKSKQIGPRASRIGPDNANRSKGYLKTSAGFDMHPALMLHQAARASANYTGRISKAATRELIDTIAYRVPGSERFLRGDSKLLSKITDPTKVAYISQAKLDRVLKQLDELPEGKWMDEADVKDVFADKIPDGANKSDYVAVHADAKDVWTEAMTDGGKLARYYDTALTYWKGGLLALSPKWYLNNTVGLALQYGVLAGADVRSILRGNSREVREAIEARAPWIAKDTLAHEALGNVKVGKFIRSGFAINSKLEELWRRAAYVNRSKRLLGNEGVRYSRLTSAEFAKALETMPDSAIRSIARDVDFFIGDYRKFNALEKNVIKRVLPFWSWLRVIGRLTLAMPFRSPTRVFLMNVLANASAAGIDPARYSLPWYERSALVFGNTRVGVNAANPAATLGGFFTAPGEMSPGRALGKEAQGWITPFATAPFSYVNGMNTFGNVINPSPGTAPYGRDREYINPVTQVSSSQPPGLSGSEAFLSTMLPGQVGIARKVFSGGWTPRDDVDTLDVIRDFINRESGGERNYSLYYNKNPNGPLTPFGFTPYLSALTGVKATSMDQQAIARRLREDAARIRSQDAALKRARAKARRP